MEERPAFDPSSITLPWALDKMPSSAAANPLLRPLAPAPLARAGGSLSTLLGHGRPLPATTETEGLDCVAAGLFIASGRAASRLRDLTAARISHVVNAAPSVELCYHRPALVRARPGARSARAWARGRARRAQSRPHGGCGARSPDPPAATDPTAARPPRASAAF